MHIDSAIYGWTHGTGRSGTINTSIGGFTPDVNWKSGAVQLSTAGIVVGGLGGAIAAGASREMAGGGNWKVVGGAVAGAALLGLVGAAGGWVLDAVEGALT